tara:strand:- start:11102 stop:11842 length:741 start_codon:yes stop_codon:yes gene_type:complete
MEIAFHKIFNPEKFVIVSFYTIGNLYEREKDFFIYSMNLLQINYIIYKIDSNQKFDDNKELNTIKKWNYITYIKPKILLEIIEKFNYDKIVWCDIDSMFFNYPKELDLIKEDYGFYKNNNKKFLSGVLYFKNNSKTKDILNLWIEKLDNIKIKDINLDNYMALSDQKILGEIIETTNIKYYNLGKKNFGIYDKILLNKEKYTDYYIVHFQASRRNTHKFVNKEKHINEEKKIKIFRDNLFKVNIYK